MKQKLIHVVRYSALISLLGGIVAGVAHAADSVPAIASNVTDLENNLFCPIINWMFFILIGVAIIMIMWAAYKYLTAGDDTEKVHSATKTITYAAVAVVVALLAKGFPAIIVSIFNVSATAACGS